MRKCIWWQQKAEDVVPQVTRVERCVYPTQGGLSNHCVRKKLQLDFAQEFNELRDALVRLNGYVHITPEVFQLEDDDIERLALETIEAVAVLMACIQECRAAIGDRLSSAISDATVHQIVGKSLDAVDELATDYSLEQIFVDSHEVTCITSETVHIRVSGSLGLTLQWGSNSDLRRGDGAEVSESFEYTCEAPSPDPEALEFVVDSLMVDTGDWHEHEDEWSAAAAVAQTFQDHESLDATDIRSDF